MQYRLVERASLFGWPRERVLVIDDDLGKSGTSSRDRHGFQALIAEVGLGKAGLVLSLDASRLARNNRDWHQLLELCSLFGVLIADGERLYDPAAYHDRLLLGLSGIMSEAELHQIKIRLHQGERQKAARGEPSARAAMAVPSSLDDAARMDGCSHLGAFLRIVLPLTRGGLAATSIFCLINSWNEFLFALILTTRDTATYRWRCRTCSLPSGRSGARSLRSAP